MDTLLISEHGTGELLERRWKIEVISGPDAGRSIVRERGSVLVGTQPDTDLILSDAAVSRAHARFELGAEGVMVVDLKSRNGTRIRGSRVERALLLPGAV